MREVRRTKNIRAKALLETFNPIVYPHLREHEAVRLSAALISRRRTILPRLGPPPGNHR